MKQFILGFLVLSFLTTPVAFADSDSEEKSGSSKKTIDTSCVATAVGVREDALLSGWSKFDDAITSALTARKTALTSAWAKTDTKERRAAVKEAWATFKKARKDATGTYKKERREAWATFKKSVKACGGASASEASSESDSKENIEV